MDFQIDRSLPISIRQQIKGMIEYGIVCGDFAAGEMLPSVRDLATTIGVAPMTVSQVYRELKGQGLIETRTGAGTIVADGRNRQAANQGMAGLHKRIDALIDEAMAAGLRASDLASLIHARLATRTRLGRGANIVMVGLFVEATVRYARAIATQLGAAATVEAMTIDAIQRDAAVRARAASADVAITFVNRRREVESLLPGAKVMTIRFIPSEETRRALASIEPMAKVVLAARFSEFLPIMKVGVRRFAAHVAQVDAVRLDQEDCAAILAQADVLIFASGTEMALAQVRPGVPTIEYKHSPDPADVERLLAPLLRTD
ncbi:GntR family transcriptional regulator [Bosea sp. BK604]|uniref:GntR family transcriptional regulator n=1 Tax=Bosea sp. BK604 TaxID=2512180 RepID=UPI0010DFA358|nr:GntR family transcriptional regulator [Bosea sp. BK604]TCR70319.1 GntR family transcriptional regulator [Bosea sp. BK604]